MTVKVLRTDPAAQLPSYAHPGDAGMDVRSIEDVTLAPGARALVHTGLVLMLPPDAEAQVRPRSGLALKHGVTVLNTPGTIDAGYRGEVGVILINAGENDFTIARGDRIAQMVIQQLSDVQLVAAEQLSDTSRGAGGFGSTGVKNN
ncbi:MAG: dUTP diphosphatase [Schwartzia sp.]|nr:dUTP diphosphatase [Schwartzia sp. (in: firmicutes)]